jgi:hypothetical protein
LEGDEVTSAEGMSDDEVDWPDLGDFSPEEWAAYVGAPPDWYYPLVGRVATRMGLAERLTAEAALELHQPSYTFRDVIFWLESSHRLEVLTKLVSGRNGPLDELVRQLGPARARRNAIVHVWVGWHDTEDPIDPAGWHFVYPRSGKHVYLNQEEAQASMEADLNYIDDLVDRLSKLLNDLQ